MFAKILLGLETFIGLILVLTSYYSSKDNSLSDALGIEISLRNGVLLLGVFYFLRGLINLVLDLAEPSHATLIKRFLLLFESVAGFVIIITSYCDSRETAFEDYFATKFTLNHGLVILGVFFISKAFFQMVLERGDGSGIDDL